MAEWNTRLSQQREFNDEEHRQRAWVERREAGEARGEPLHSSTPLTAHPALSLYSSVSHFSQKVHPYMSTSSIIHLAAHYHYMFSFTRNAISLFHISMPRSLSETIVLSEPVTLSSDWFICLGHQGCQRVRTVDSVGLLWARLWSRIWLYFLHKYKPRWLRPAKGLPL